MTQDASLQFDLTTNLLRIGRIWRKHVRAHIDAHGISEACAHPLVAIGRLGDGVRQGPVAEEVGMEGPSLVRLLDQLCECGLVERREDPADRRAKTLWLTERGRNVMASIEADLVALRAQVLDTVPREDIEATLRVFAAFKAYQPPLGEDDSGATGKLEETP
ncbi:MarR family winged helix-turn-helix transcriptional regulator [Jiella pacifica]|uniref:MarR family transcriptional regulator n=1 Tax=Jiella pacifica TaxID=2696469 RepID=A0A6N9T4U7_9HYPH|nr:MarR family transcriptional regulator [Jiella pacifica]NDW05602.1 MarR family transcriptional regulator [Jiella pacifica]